ncbi:MAG: hypothetical protein ACMXYD_01690 [Candidatus Woesearchaeota archaeon]
MLSEQQIQTTITACKQLILQQLIKEELVALYLGGTILDNKERNEFSDIDFFAIVRSNETYKQEETINKQLEEYLEKNNIAIESRLRIFTEKSLRKQQEPIEPILQFIKPERFVQRLKHFKLLSKQQINFSTYPQAMPLKQELQHLIEVSKEMSKQLQEQNEPYPLKDFHKIVFELARVELQLQNKPYILERNKLVKELREQTKHPIHEAWRIRQTLPTRKQLHKINKELTKYTNKLAEQYLNNNPTNI